MEIVIHLEEQVQLVVVMELINVQEMVPRLQLIQVQVVEQVEKEQHLKMVVMVVQV